MRFPMVQITYVCDMCEFGRTIAIQKFLLFNEDGRTPSFGFPFKKGLEVLRICKGNSLIDVDGLEQHLTFSVSLDSIC